MSLRTKKQVVHARVDGDEVGLEHDGGLDLFVEDLVHAAAPDREVGVAHFGVGLRQRYGDMIGPSAQAVRAGRVWVADPLGERVAKRHVAGEDGHGSNLERTKRCFANRIAVY